MGLFWSAGAINESIALKHRIPHGRKIVSFAHQFGAQLPDRLLAPRTFKEEEQRFGAAL
jgi:hypothetical protein